MQLAIDCNFGVFIKHSSIFSAPTMQMYRGIWKRHKGLEIAVESECSDEKHKSTEKNGINIHLTVWIFENGYHSIDVYN